MSDATQNGRGDLQEYLDGRLPDERRAEFEKKLARSARLRRELENALEIREALGATVEELSPGFYTRARARFEQSAGSAGARWSFRLLSWETAGVAAAAALATALFVPWLMDEGIPEDPGRVTTEQAQAPTLDEEFARETADKDLADVEGLEAQSEPAPTDSRRAAPESQPRRLVAKEKSEKAPAKQSGERDQAAGKGDWSPEPEGAVGVESVLADRPPSEPDAPAPRSRSKTESRTLEEQKKRAAPSSGRATQSGVSDDSLDRIERENEAFRSAGAAVEHAPAGKPQSILVELHEGLVAAGEMRTVEDLDEWKALLDGPHGRVLAMLGPPDPDRRLVLVGAREGLVCDALRLESDGRAYRIDADSARTDSGVAGCAFTLPRDGRPVSVGRAGGEPRDR